MHRSTPFTNTGYNATGANGFGTYSPTRVVRSRLDDLMLTRAGESLWRLSRFLFLNFLLYLTLNFLENNNKQARLTTWGVIPSSLRSQSSPATRTIAGTLSVSHKGQTRWPVALAASSSPAFSAATRSWCLLRVVFSSNCNPTVQLQTHNHNQQHNNNTNQINKSTNNPKQLPGEYDLIHRKCMDFGQQMIVFDNYLWFSCCFVVLLFACDV